MAILAPREDTIDGLALRLRALYVPDLLLAAQYGVIQPQRCRPLRLLFATGTCAAGLRSPHEDIHLVCMTEDNRHTFWQIVAEAFDIEALQTPADDVLALPSRRGWIEGHGIPPCIYLCRCSVPSGFDPSTLSRVKIPFYSPQQQQVLSQNEQRHLAMIIDADGMTSSRFALNRREDEWILFSAAYLLVLEQAQSERLLAPAFGFLDHEALMWMVYNVTRDSSIAPLYLAATERLAYAFWYKCAMLESFTQLEVHTPTRTNIASHVTPQAVQSLSKLGKCVVQYYSRKNLATELTSILALFKGFAPIDGYRRFIHSAKEYVLIEFELWSPNGPARRQMQQQIPDLVKAVATQLNARVWPKPLDSTPERSVFALALFDHREGYAPSKQALPYRTRSYHYLESLLPYDRTGAVISLTAQTGQHLQAKYPPEQVEQPAPPTHNVVPKLPAPGQRFRDARSAMEFLLYGSMHANTEYEVGYHDRFEGLKWIALADWRKKGVDHEDFIPLHRIRKLRRVADGTVVWDREKRVDLTGVT
ncbi:hypothetical protein D0869_07243 [Hortaea werneckii]|uniref:MJ1316 RNA cyclic group end recognition domain-containing protein n=1 Tax=Hortaea werneckii TaxID=91943 RepID=A0A3M6YPA0_HORWE|nr:hypothetical protein KC324_g5323 [Hortaea werneckii]KAI7587088.1 hypothetical protein KC316_g5241 [Hortaea werneckii]RMX80847.1 hypothetical protein D0869_07243 [Hortaea werneckii]RMY04874.1 hypothetical protein D0868_06716 [Hortaea werneckii]